MARDMATLTLGLRVDGSEKTISQISMARGEAEKLGVAFDKMSKETKGVATSTGKLNKSLTTSSGRLKVIGRDINRYVTLPLMAFSAASIKFASDLNQGLAGVQTLIPATGDRIDELKVSIRELSVETGRSFKDLTDGLYRTISVFQDNEETMERMEVATKAAMAGFSSTAESVQLLASVTRAYGDTSAAAVAKVSDLAFEAIRLGDTTFPALAGAMQVATDRAVRLGVSQEELFTTFATLTGITGDASMVATQFRSAMDSLLRPTDALTQLMQQYGYASAEAMIENMGMLNTLVAINKAAEASGRPLQDYITRKEGITLVSRLATEQLEDFAWKLDDINNHLGATDTAYESVTDGVDKFGHSLRQSRQAVATAFSEIGDKMLPMFAALSAILAGLLTAFSDLPPAIQYVIGSLAALVSILGVVSMVAGVFESLKLAGVFTAIAAKVKVATVALIGFHVALGPIGIALGVLTAAWVGVSMVSERAARNQADAIALVNSGLNKQSQEVNRLATAYDNFYDKARLSRQGTQTGMLDQGVIPSIDMLTDGAAIAQREGQQDQKGLDITGIGVFFPGGTKAIADMGEKEKKAIKEKYGEWASLIRTEMGSVIGKMSQYRDRLTEVTKEMTDGVGALSDSLTADVGKGMQRTGMDNPIDYIIASLEALDDWKAKGEGEFGGYLTRLIQDGYGLSEAFEGLGIDIQALVKEYGTLDEAMNVIRGQHPEIDETAVLLGQLEAVVDGLSMTTQGATKSWQEWMAEITEAPVRIGQSGKQAAATYKEFQDQVMENKINFLEAFGITPNTSEMLEERLTSMRAEIQEKLDIDPKEIDDAFKLGDSVFTDKEIGLIKQYRDTVKETADALVTDLNRAWEDSANSMRLVSDALTPINDETVRFIKDADFFKKAIEDTVEAMERLKNEHGGTRQEMVMLRLELVGLSIQYEATTARADALAVSVTSFGQAFSEGGSGNLGDWIVNMSKGLVSLSGSIEEAKADLESLGEASLHNADAIELISNNILDLEERSEKYQKVMGVMVGSVVQLASVFMNNLNPALYEYGRMLEDGARSSEKFELAMKHVWRSLLEAIGPIMIQAGLMLLPSPVGIGLLLGGLAMSVAAPLILGAADQRATDKRDSLLGIDQNAKGGLINSPTMLSGRKLAGEAGTEAIMPLERNKNGELGVKASTPHIEHSTNITVINEYGADATVEQTDDGEGNIAIIFKKAVKEMIRNGAVDKEMRSRYAVRPSV